MTTAIYARYSDPHQRETSIDDQVRNCTRHAEREGMHVDRVYADKAVTGAVTARHEYQAMIAAAARREFSTLIVDDLSRLNRDDYEMKGVLRKFAWWGVRVVSVSDGFDTASKGHKIHAGFKGLMNEIFLDDLRDRTHRGMTGQAMKGFNCGGRTYGYRNVPIEDAGRKESYGRAAVSAVKYELHPEQADIVRKIYGWYAAGCSYQWIAAELNRLGVPSSRGRSWAVSAVKVILDNSMYEGVTGWNRKQWVKHPDTGKRTYRKRPLEECIRVQQPELRIVDEDTVQAVRARQAQNAAAYRATKGLPSARRYLFSGVLACAECGGNMVIVAKGRYGCATYHTRSPLKCSTGITVSRHIVEERLLTHIKERLRAPEHVQRFARSAMTVLQTANDRSQLERLKRQLVAANRVLENLLDAIRQGVVTTSTKMAVQDAEAEVQRLTSEIARLGHSTVAILLPRAVERYRRLVDTLETQLVEHVEQARHILKSLFGEAIRIHRIGSHLEAEISQDVRAVLSKCLSLRFDSPGCGGPQRGESVFISLAPTLADSTPLKHRRKAGG